MDSSRSERSGRSRSDKGQHSLPESPRKSEKAKNAEKGEKVASTTQNLSRKSNGDSSRKGIKNYLCCGSRAEDVYEQRRNEHRRPDEVPQADSARDVTKKQPSPTATINTSGAPPSTGSVGPKTLYNQLPSGYVSRPVNETPGGEVGKAGPVSSAVGIDSTHSHKTSITSSVRHTNRTQRTTSPPKPISGDISEIDNSEHSDKALKPSVHTIPAKPSKAYSERSAATANTVKSHHRPHTNSELSKPTTGVSASSSGHSYSASHGTASLTPVAASVSHNGNIFADMNHMEDVTGIKLDRSQPTSGEAIAVMGDEHLTRLEETCKKLLAKMSVEKAELRKQSGTEILTALASPSSAKFTQVSLAFTEVLQMQNRPKEALAVLSKAIEELNADLIHAKKYRNGTLESGISASASASNQVVEFDHLKKMKALCHRRVGSLYKLSSRYPDAEEHVRKYIGMMERHGSSVAIRREVATAYSLLASIYELMGRSDDAQAADLKGLELAAS